MRSTHINSTTDFSRYPQYLARVSAPVSPSVTVFIVSGDSGMRQALYGISESMGTPYAAYATAEAFLAAFDSTRLGCLLLDVHAPQMGGLILQQQLQHQNSRLPPSLYRG